MRFKLKNNLKTKYSNIYKYKQAIYLFFAWFIQFRNYSVNNMSEPIANNFTFIEKKFPSIYGKENKEFLIKWSVRHSFSIPIYFKCSF